jgi:hypothetical protein
MILEAPAVRHVVGSVDLTSFGPGPRICQLAATALIPAGRLGDGLSAEGLQTAIEAALEELAAELEGDQNQELIITGTQECGDIELELSEVAVHASLRDYHAWLRSGSIVPKARLELRLALEIEGEEEAVHVAVAAILRELGSWVPIGNVTMTWRNSLCVAETGLSEEASECKIG